jgi:glycosyltransferase involved in cell wall biosynthesis
MNVFALTSRMEGMPLAILEAWAAGLPVVASAVGGVRDLVAHGQNGLLFPNGDASALTAALEQVLTDRRTAAALAEAGQAQVRSEYSVERMAATYDAHYRDLLASSQ